MGLFNRHKPQADSKIDNTVSPQTKLAWLRELSPVGTDIVDIDAELKKSLGSSAPTCTLIYETDEYYIYKFLSFLLRRSKNNMANVVFLGRCVGTCCFYMGYIFQWNRIYEYPSSTIIANNIQTGKTVNCDWLGKGYVAKPGGGNHEYVTQDTINNVYETNGRLIFNISRKKSLFFPIGYYPDDYDINSDYTLTVTLENGIIKVVRSFSSPVPKLGIGARFTLPKTFVKGNPQVSGNSVSKTALSIPQANTQSGRQDPSFVPAGTMSQSKTILPQKEDPRQSEARIQKDESTAPRVAELSVKDFYIECVKSFVEKAQARGFAERDTIFIPELMPFGFQALQWFYRNDTIKQRHLHPGQYYFVAIISAIQCGIVFASQWHENYDCMKTDSYVEDIMERGVSIYAEPLYKSILSTDVNKFKGLTFDIYSKWLSMHKPYWNKPNAKDYTFQATVAAYQLGISMTLAKLGY